MEEPDENGQTENFLKGDHSRGWKPWLSNAVENLNIANLLLLIRKYTHYFTENSLNWIWVKTNLDLKACCIDYWDPCNWKLRPFINDTSCQLLSEPQRKTQRKTLFARAESVGCQAFSHCAFPCYCSRSERNNSNDYNPKMIRKWTKNILEMEIKSRHKMKRYKIVQKWVYRTIGL